MKYCFIFPHAGALRSDYKNFESSFGGDLKCFYYSREEHQDDLWSDNIKSSALFIEKNISDFDGDYIIIGHSMGAMQAYFTTKLLEDSKVRRPAILFLSSMFPPTQENIEELNELIELPDENFSNAILSLGGIPKQILERKDFFKFFMSRIKSDIYKMRNLEISTSRIKSRIVCLSGDKDKKYSFIKMNEWCRYSHGPFEIKVFKGDHFYIVNLYEEVTDYIKELLAKEIS